MNREGSRWLPEYTLPELDYDYSALEPHISGQINEIHHSKHHATYVKGLNDAAGQARGGPRQGRSVGHLSSNEKNPRSTLPAVTSTTHLVEEPVAQRWRQAHR